MKKKLLLFVLLFAGLMSVKAADGTVSITNVRNAVPGYAGTFDVVLSGTDVTYTGFQFNITLPEGFTITDCEGGALMTDHNINYNKPGDDNMWIFAGNSATVSAFSQLNGVLVTIKFTIDNSVSLGEKTGGKLEGCDMSESGTSHTAAGSTFSITTTDVVTLYEDETEAPAAIANHDVKVIRELKGGMWNTIVLPFDITEDKIASTFGAGTEIGYFTGYEVSAENVVSVSFETRTSIAAHTPYVIHVPATLSEFTVPNTSITTTDEDPAVIYGKYEGSGKNKHYEGKDMIGTYVAETIIPDYGVFLSNGAFTFSKGLSKLKAFRAYFDLYDAEYDDSGAAPSFILNFVDSSATAISTVETKASEVPAVYYNLSGQRVANPTKGLYIVNGKKVVVK